ncbi:MAG: copper amine oxidase N-terminal domain-containing protein, partial [Clostridiales bacterium]|nr:copper amine oxidase N-terminal domain-containing protein [Clostridiales bacterium]
DKSYSIVVDKNEYTVENQVIPLEAAPTNQEGYVYVPVSFFEKVLGATYTVETDGTIVIS